MAIISSAYAAQEASQETNSAEGGADTRAPLDPWRMAACKKARFRRSTHRISRRSWFGSC